MGTTERILKMPLKRLIVPMIVVGALMSSPCMRAQDGRESGKDIHRDGWERIVPDPPKGQTSAPAPKRDLTGIWEPTPRYRDGVFATGPKEYPSDGKPEHQLPFTPEGEKAWKSHKPGFGTTAVPIAENNDPFDICDPIGFPRLELFNLRAIQVFQTPKQVAIIYQNDQVWRNIWVDGRELPKEILEPRWYGYSVGKWTDDYTFVVDTIGLDERTWIDNVGRPHSDQLKVTETFHRASQNLLELTVTVDDPKFYTKPWVGMNKFVFHRLPDDYDMGEMICSPQEVEEYKKSVAAPVAGGAK
jgi:hypothetical protein